MVSAEPSPETPFKDARTFMNHVNFLRRIVKDKRSMITLPMLLLLSADRGYSLPVDRVWALIGLLNKRYQKKMRDANLVDYSDLAISSYRKTFLSIVKFHIKHDRDVAMDMIEANLRTIRNPLLPSWCPDWHTDRGEIPLSKMEESRAGFPGGEYRPLRPFMQLNEDDTLELCGLQVDIIRGATPSAAWNIGSLDSYSWLNECMKIIDSTTFVPYDVYPEKFALPSPPTTERYGTPLSEPQQRLKRLEGVLKYLLYPPGVETSSPTIRRCTGHKFFRTEGSRLGIGPANLEENDLLCAVYGARTLWVLRPCKPNNNVEGEAVSEVGPQSTAGYASNFWAALIRRVCSKVKRGKE